ncbi:cytochrome c family protein (plasmid) [Ruegeria pomeroyi DSS-3]|uniref:Cytochrome c family protein n=2 Tax=Ruegeria pomeroyi TaxID=89184 RepID=Q5LKM0_RUEPO|nr:cytochrome c [Ruegeria pomeroyi]AAV97493.1 cytochrome c family protein [Ruegeria pomeroyi DSS-3]NVK97827.1 cytochrome c [Ruegeria pomeroyi]NVL01353.1 cytochrome c [Ruegeria pomeroyi]HCE71800.1 cytochrome C [Ruegeria sp.]
MKPVYLAGSAVAIIALAAVIYAARATTGPVSAGASTSVSVVSDATLAQGETLYQENCASCHGRSLEGQPNWREPDADGRLPAPPHDESGHTWHHPDSMLFDYTKFGGQATLAALGVELESGMPAFGEQLSDDQIRSILDYIKSTWPARVRAAQAERTRADEEARNQ